MSKRARHATYNINCHPVWCPKYRRPVLAGSVGARLAELLPQYVRGLGGEVLDLVVMPDHVHLSASFPPTVAISQIMYRLKRATAHQLRKEFPHLKSRLPSLWMRSYYVGTAGHVSAHDAGLAEFRQLLAYKAERAGPRIVAVNPTHTSRVCSGCGAMVRKSLSVRVPVCPDRVLTLGRDVHTARIS